MSRRDAMAARPVPAPRSSWRWFPWGVVGAMLVVIAVNIGMAISAFQTFPGKTTSDGFSESNKYNRVLEKAEQEAALGWKLDASAEAGQPVVRLIGPDGQALSGARLAGRAVRPVGEARETVLDFTEIAPGTYRAAASLPDRGQWDLMVAAEKGADALHVTRRVLIR